MHDHAHDVSGVRGQANHRLLAISLSLTSVVMLVQIVGAVMTLSLIHISEPTRPY